MSLPPIISASFTYDPERGKEPLKVQFDDGSFGYDAIEEVGNLSETIDEHGDWVDYIHEE